MSKNPPIVLDSYDVSLKVARLRLFAAGITTDREATEDEIADVMHKRGITYHDFEAIWYLVGADGMMAVRSILSEPA